MNKFYFKKFQFTLCIAGLIENLLYQVQSMTDVVQLSFMHSKQPNIRLFKKGCRHLQAKVYMFTRYWLTA